jgi:hypothetical protein
MRQIADESSERRSGQDRPFPEQALNALVLSESVINGGAELDEEIVGEAIQRAAKALALRFGSGPIECTDRSPCGRCYALMWVRLVCSFEQRDGGIVSAIGSTRDDRAA